MLIQIIQHTPTWVFILFCALVYLGISRTRPRTVAVRRILTMPLAISAYAFYNIYAAFAIGVGQPGVSPDSILLASLLAWLFSAAAVLALLFSLGPRRDVDYLPQTQQFRIPGSWFPLCWLMSIFFTKYVVAVMLATHVSLHGSASFATAIGVLYGAASGTLVGSAWRIWRVMLDHDARPAALNL